MQLSLYYINLSKYPLKSIKEIAEFNTLEDIDLFSLKKKGYNKVWIDTKTITVVATSKLKRNKDSISLTRDFHNRIIAMDFAKINNEFYEKSDVINIFKFDLTSDLSKAKVICDKYNLSYETLIHNKEKKLRKIWLSDTGDGIVYFENCGWECVVSSYFINDIKNCKEWTLSIPKGVDTIDKSVIIFDVDIILDKISAYGIDALTKEELSFLDSQ